MIKRLEQSYTYTRYKCIDELVTTAKRVDIERIAILENAGRCLPQDHLPRPFSDQYVNISNRVLPCQEWTGPYRACHLVDLKDEIPLVRKLIKKLQQRKKTKI